MTEIKFVKTQQIKDQNNQGPIEHYNRPAINYDMKIKCFNMIIAMTLNGVTVSDHAKYKMSFLAIKITEYYWQHEN